MIGSDESMHDCPDHDCHRLPDYMQGMCHVYALALHRLHGWPLLLLVDNSEPYADGVPAVHHVYALDGLGMAHDHAGLHLASNVVEQWVGDCSEGGADTVELEDEQDLAMYVESVRDAWDKPLEFYDDADMEATSKLIHEQGRGLETPGPGMPG